MQTLLPWENIEKKVHVRLQATTNPLHGCKPEDRPTEQLLKLGIVNLNKPSGPTSHQVSAYVQDILGIDKAGHTGTLDPKVTGVLPVALGSGTKVVQTLLPAGKEYVCLMHLHGDVSKKTVKEALRGMVGKIKQLPPIKSAVKRQVREREIYYIEFLEMQGREVLFRVGCQGGTYIRKLCTDLGEQLGIGAHMAELVRSKAGPFNDTDMVTLQDLRDGMHYHKEGNDTLLRSCIKPIEAAVRHLGKVYVVDGAIAMICHGRDVKLPGVAKVQTHIEQGDLLAIMTLKGELIALGEAKMDTEVMARNERGIAVKVKKVLMDPATYPKLPSRDTA